MPHRRQNFAPGSNHQDRIKQKAANEERRKALIAGHMATRSTNEPVCLLTVERLQRDPNVILTGIDGLNFYNIGESATPRPLATIYRTLVEAAVAVMNSGGRQVLLCWPPQSICLSAIVDLLALGDVGSAPQRQVTPEPGRIDIVADPPVGVRAVLYPYARTTHVPAREIQVDRQGLATLHMRHRMRHVHGGDCSALTDYHLVLNRVRAMTGRAKDGQTYTEFEHPVLDEIVPHGNATGGCRDNGHLLWRTKSKTDLGEFSRTGAADQPSTARFYLFEIGASDNVTRELRAIGEAPDLIVLDFSKTGRSRLGREWITVAQKTVEAIGLAC